MPRFRYVLDPLFLGCLAVYLINRLWLEKWYPGTFFESYLNDLICIPFWVPLMLGLLRVLGLRRHDAPPGAIEILVPLVIWASVFEVWLPMTETYRGRAIADPADVLCYVIGAAVAFEIWQRRSVPTGS